MRVRAVTALRSIPLIRFRRAAMTTSMTGGMWDDGEKTLRVPSAPAPVSWGKAGANQPEAPGGARVAWATSVGACLGLTHNAWPHTR